MESPDKILFGFMRDYIDKHLFSQLGDKVLSGPFCGMQIAQESAWADGNVSTKLLGSYEFELHDAVEEMIDRAPERVINLGCAEGYYAIGLARRLPDAQVFAIDESIDSLTVLGLLAKCNDVGVKTICRKAVSPEDVLEFGKDTRTLWMVDVEGAELDLLYAGGMEEDDLIVECHDFLFPERNITQTLIDRFQSTHLVTKVVPSWLKMEAYDRFVGHLSYIMRVLILVEKRPIGTTWLVMRSKQDTAT